MSVFFYCTFQDNLLLSRCKDTKKIGFSLYFQKKFHTFAWNLSLNYFFMTTIKRYSWLNRRLQRLLLLLFCCVSLPAVHASVHPGSTKLYTAENPLIYEDACDLWPYSYINDEGQPEGFNIDLIERLLQELNIPYIIRLKASTAVMPSPSSPRASSRRRTKR